MKNKCSFFVAFVQNGNEKTYTISFILIFQLNILKQNQKSPRFSQQLWITRDIVFFFYHKFWIQESTEHSTVT